MKELPRRKAFAAKEFGKRLGAYRAKTGLSVREVAERVGVPVSTYREWEYGRAIKGEPYANLASAYGISLSELMTGAQSTPRPLLAHIDSLEITLRLLKRDLQSFSLNGKSIKG